VGRHVLPETLERRVTFPDVIHGIVEQTRGAWRESDFLPLPCAHPNAHSLAYAYREGARSVPLTRFIDIANHLDLLANGITFNRSSARTLIGDFLSRQNCGCSEGCGPVQLPGQGHAGRLGGLPVIDQAETPAADQQLEQLAAAFFRRCVAEELSPADVFRITTTSFMDAYNFDIRQLMKSCVHHLLPSGHLIPFCAYNLLYRDGHVPLPALAEPAQAELYPLAVEVAD
jgi:hypothetical protein